jgi:hypothetical protein
MLGRDRLPVAPGEGSGAKKEMVENAKKAEYTVGSMNAQLANWYCWYRFTWHPSGWRGAIL